MYERDVILSELIFLSFLFTPIQCRFSVKFNVDFINWERSWPGRSENKGEDNRENENIFIRSQMPS